MKKIITILSALLISAGIVFCWSFFCTFDECDGEDFRGITLRVASSVDISAGSLAEGAELFADKYGCAVEFTDDFKACDLLYTSGEDFSVCIPITEYVNINDKLYTKQIIEDTCTQDGEVFGITNALLGNINYSVYYPEQMTGITMPYEYYKHGEWTWNNFIQMGNDLESNISIDWTKSYINMQRALIADGKGGAEYNYNTQQQIEWLNFVRTLIYDEGIVDNTEGAFKVGFLPELVLDSVEADIKPRYIPWPSKNGKLSEVFVDEYHFCVPETTQNVRAAVKLAKYMIKSCSKTRLNLYRARMTAEDFEIFKKQIKKTYSYPKHKDYVPAQLFVDDFVHGKTVTEHIYNVENDAEHIK